MTNAELDALPELERRPTLAFPDGQLLFDETRSCLGFPLVGAGSIKVFKSFPNGRELLLYHVTPGEACVVSAASLFANRPYTASAVTQGDVRLKMIPPGLFDELLAHAPFRRFVLGQFTQRLSDLMALVDAVFTHGLDQRVAARLLVHRAEFGDAFAMTHQQLADELGSIREVVSRLLPSSSTRAGLRSNAGRSGSPPNTNWNGSPPRQGDLGQRPRVRHALQSTHRGSFRPCLGGPDERKRWNH